MKFKNKIFTFLNSLIWHIYWGFPKSTKSQILDRYSICIDCEDFDTKNAQCLLCGCNINKKQIFMNKLAWADQECPAGKWGSLIKK